MASKVLGEGESERKGKKSKAPGQTKGPGGKKEWERGVPTWESKEHSTKEKIKGGGPPKVLGQVHNVRIEEKKNAKKRST